MRSTLFLTLLFIVAAVNCGPLPSKEAEELVQDGNYDASKVAKEDGKGAVKLIGPGYVDLVVSSGSLMVGVDIKGCKGKVLFCYPAKSGEMMKDATELCRAWPGFCGFQLDGTENGKITLTLLTKASKESLKVCLNDIRMQYSKAEYCTDIAEEPVKDVSCNAAISAEDGRIRIHVKNADPQNCPVSIKYAKIYVPPTTTPVPTTAPPSKATSSNGTIMKNDDKAADASSQQLTWIVLGCLIGVIILGLIGGILLCRFKKWCMFKKNTAETLPQPLQPVESIVSTTVTTKADENVTVDEKPKEEVAKAKKPETIAAAPAKKSEKVLPLAPTPPSAQPSTKPPSPAKSAKKPKEKKGNASPATAATPSKKAPMEKKTALASPGKKPAEKQRVPASSAGKKISKEATEKRSDSTQSYSAPFGLVPFRAASPPRRPIDPEILERRRLGSKKDSLELPSFSGGKPVYCQYAREKQRKEKAAAEAWKKKQGEKEAAAAEARKKKKRSQKK